MQIYRLDDGTSLFINTTASRIWELCDGIRTIEEIAEIIASETEDEIEDQTMVRKDVRRFLIELARERLIRWP